MKNTKTFIKRNLNWQSPAQRERELIRLSPVTYAGQSHNFLGIIGDIATGAVKVAGKAVNLLSGSRVTYKEFIKERNRVFKEIEKYYGTPTPWEKIPGNPFASKFSHAAIKRDITKDYKNDLAEFMAMVHQYFPEMFKVSNTPNISTASASIQDEYKKAIETGLLEAGVVPSGDIDNDTKIFAEQVAGTSGNGAALEDAVLAFLGSLAAKKKSGEQLPPAFDKIAGIAINMEGKVRHAVNDNVTFSIGEFVRKNWVIMVIAVLAVYFASRQK